jgi:hypothetical protein
VPAAAGLGCDASGSDVRSYRKQVNWHCSKAEIETGMYKKPIEAVAREVRYDRLPAEARTVVIQSWKNFGLLPPGFIEQMVLETISVPSPELPHKSTE